jgi:hypothetical protein
MGIVIASRAEKPLRLFYFPEEIMAGAKGVKVVGGIKADASAHLMKKGPKRKGGEKAVKGGDKKK